MSIGPLMVRTCSLPLILMIKKIPNNRWNIGTNRLWTINGNLSCIYNTHRFQRVNWIFLNVSNEKLTTKKSSIPFTTMFCGVMVGVARSSTVCWSLLLISGIEMVGISGCLFSETVAVLWDRIVWAIVKSVISCISLRYLVSVMSDFSFTSG